MRNNELVLITVLLSLLKLFSVDSLVTSDLMSHLSSSEMTRVATCTKSSSDVNQGERNDAFHPLTTFGVLADIQYAPIPDGFSYGGVPRYYRHSLSTAKHAALHFEKEKVSMLINLGDIIDGKCQEMEHHIEDPASLQGRLLIEPGHAAVDDVLNALSAYKSGPILHTYGNHELYNLDREDIAEKLQIPFVKESCDELVGYYSMESPCGIVRFVILDSYDIALMKRQTSKKAKAMEILSKNNPNYPDQENSPEGLEGLEKRFVAFNGAVDVPQIEWLRSTLEEAKVKGEKVIILSHQPILPGSSSPVCLIWNYDVVLNLLREYKCTVAAAFAGHAHRGGYKRDEESGIHFRVFEAALESNDPVKTYAFVDVYQDRIAVRGLGDCKSADYDLDHMQDELHSRM